MIYRWSDFMISCQENMSFYRIALMMFIILHVHCVVFDDESIMLSPITWHLGARFCWAHCTVLGVLPPGPMVGLSREQAEDHDPRFFSQKSLQQNHCWILRIWLVVTGTWLWFSPISSGKLTFCYGKSPFSMGKSTINEPFSIAMLVYQRVVGMIQSDVHSMIFQRGRLKPPTMKNVDECCESTTLSPF